MDRIFIEEEKDGQYRIAAVDRHRIFQAANPGLLATIFECSLKSPSMDDRAQIFYALGPQIGALDYEIDLRNRHRSVKLNYWSIQERKPDTDSLFLSIRPLSDQDRLQLYAVKHSISPTETVRAESPSLFSLLALSSQQKWKTGILQRCIDCLVSPEHRGIATVYATIDKHYRYLLRFKLETEGKEVSPLCQLIRDITRSLGLRHSHDSIPFTAVPPATLELMAAAMDFMPIVPPSGSDFERLAALFKSWSGGILISTEGYYQITVPSELQLGESYLDRLLPVPSSLIILEAPL